MSWKSLVTACLFCVLASPVFAQPKLQITNGGLDASGNWIWNVQLAPNAANDVLATELGFKQTVGNGIKSVTNNNTTNFDYNNPGAIIFGWEKTYGSPLRPEGLEGNFTGAATGTTVANASALGGNAQTACLTSAAGCAAAGAGTNEIFSAMGSNVLASTAFVNYLRIITNGPTNANNVSSIALSGAYDGTNKSGRIGDNAGAGASNYKNFTGTASRTLAPGDIDASGTTDGADFSFFATKWQQTGLTGGWASGDFNRDGTVDGADFSYFATGWQTSGTNTPLSKTGVLDPPGAGAGSGLSGGSGVPEPASIALLGLALLGGLGIIGRKR